MKNSAPLCKRTLIFLLTVILLFAILFSPAYAITLPPITTSLPSVDITRPALSTDYDYTVNNGITTITKYKGTASSVTIPSQLPFLIVRV
jgi:hypothetical protein